MQRREGERPEQLQKASTQQASTAQGTVKFDISKHIKLILAFSEDNPEAFFREFETTASHFMRPKEHWAWLIKPKLVGKGITVCEGIEDNTDYSEVKEAIISSYSVSTEGYRQPFRNKPSQQTFTEIASEKLNAIVDS